MKGPLSTPVCTRKQKSAIQRWPGLFYSQLQHSLCTSNIATTMVINGKGVVKLTNFGDVGHLFETDLSLTDELCWSCKITYSVYSCISSLVQSSIIYIASFILQFSSLHDSLIHIMIHDHMHVYNHHSKTWYFTHTYKLWSVLEWMWLVYSIWWSWSWEWWYKITRSLTGIVW